MEVRSFAENLLSGLPVPQPSLALVTAAAALQPVSGRSMWHAWVAKDAPEAASTEISNWLMGIGHYHSPALVISSRLHPECSFTPTSSSTTTAQWSPAVSPSKYSTVDLRPLSQGGLLPTETPRIVRGRAADDKHWLDSARPNGINRPQNQPGQEHRGLSGLILEPQELDRLNSLQQWVEESSASVSIKGSVLDWMEGHNHHGQPQQQPCAWDEPCQERKPSKLESVANSQSRRMQAEHEAEEENSAAGCSGLGEVVGCPLVHVGSYIPTGVETEVVRALLGSGESEPRFVGIWGVSCSGKSQAAAAAVATPATRRAFFGGVVWVDMEVLDSSSHADEGTAVCRLLAERVARLPGCRPCWPPTHLIKSPDTGAAELRAWMGVRIANLPGPVLLVLDGISSPVQLQGLCALGASVLLLATSRAALTSLASPRPDPKYLRCAIPPPPASLSQTANLLYGDHHKHTLIQKPNSQ